MSDGMTDRRGQEDYRAKALDTKTTLLKKMQDGSFISQLSMDDLMKIVRQYKSEIETRVRNL